MDYLKIKDKRILITGAGSGIGKAAAITLSKYDCLLSICGRSPEKILDTFQQIEPRAEHQSFNFDVTDANAVATFAQECLPIDGLILAAGIDDIKPIKFLSTSDFLNIIKTNSLSTHLLISTLIKQKKINRNASIVFISSVEGTLIHTPAHSAYGVSKAALTAYTKYLALELSGMKIRANSIAPAMIDTPMIEGWKNQLSAEEWENDQNKYPLKRYGTTDDVVSACLFLLSDASQWITGTQLVVDGGLSLVS